MIWTRLCNLVSPKMCKMNADLICNSRHDMKDSGIATCGLMLLVINEADPKLANQPKQMKHQFRQTLHSSATPILHSKCLHLIF